MPTKSDTLRAEVERCFSSVRNILNSGTSTAEESYYTPLVNLLDAVGRSLKPKVFCVPQLSNQGGGHPDIGLFATNQVSKGQPKPKSTEGVGIKGVLKV